MTRSSGLWTEVTTSEFVHERAALDFVRRRLPDREPFRAWTNFTFIADDGTRNEVDLLVISPTGVYLVEVKSHPGRMDGDAGTWVWTTPEGKRRTFDNPLLLTERKAKKLKSLLQKQPALRGRGFYVRAAVFLANTDLTVALNAAGRTDVYGPDPDEGHPQRNHLPGLVDLLRTVDGRRGAAINRPLSRAIGQAVEQAGIRESTAHRRVGIYELTEPLAEGRGWQDFAAEHPHARGTHRRIRVYLTGLAQSEDERQALRRAADREFRFLQGIDHPGIEQPIELLSSARGPALVFPYDPAARRLDHWLADNGDVIDLLDRIQLVRDLAETLRHAHRQGLYHRALAPQHVSVSERRGKAHLRIRDWQAAARAFTSSSPTTGTAHVIDLVDERAHVYLAPETLRLPDAQSAPADIWSLGAVAFLILSGSPPAEDVEGLHAILRQQGCLTLAAAMDAPDSDLDFVIRQATMAEFTNRFVSVDEFLEYLDLAVERLTSPEEKDPLDAARGDVIAEAWRVVRRFGSGSTSVVLLTERDGRREVLKVARDEAHAARLREEHEVLRQLRHRTFVEPYGLESMAGRTVLRLEAALSSLAEELRDQGALSLDLLERYGGDLLDALVELDAEGVTHRDIKPDNLGVAERGKNHERHLVLFDFSLTRADPTDLRAGTVGYLDPFLEEREPRRWDTQAERYAAAVTLYEMSTGARPVWGDGSTDPFLTDLDLPTIDGDRFDPSVRDQLRGFFTRGLHRDPERRFDTAEDMRRAWGQALAGADRPVLTDEGLAAADVDLADVSVGTSVDELAVSARVRNVLERLEVATLGDLAAVPPSRLVRLAGIGAATRKEVAHLAQRVRERIADVPVGSDAEQASIDRIVDQLVPKPPADEDHRTAVAALLGLVEEPVGDWPTLRAVAERTGLERRVVADALASARTRWLNRPDITAVRADLVDLLRRREGIAGSDELAAALLTARGSLVGDPLRSRRARATLRAAVEAESALGRPRMVARRLGEALLVALDGELAGDEGPQRWDADRMTEVAAAVGEVAEGLAAQRPLPGPARIVSALRQVQVPDGFGPLSDAQLVRLAAAAADGVAVSPRLQLYPRGMAAEEAVAEARGALLDRQGLTPAQIGDRLRARLPDAAPLPARPALDRLLEPLGLQWQSGQGRYLLPARGGLLSTISRSAPYTSSFRTEDERERAVRDLDARLAHLAADGGFLALTVDRHHLAEAAPAILAQVRGTLVDLEFEIIAAMRAAAVNAGADWQIMLAADAAPRGDRLWGVLQRLIDRALPEVEQRLRAVPGTAVVTGLGLLARYDRLSVLERIRDAVTRDLAGQPLSGLVAVVPGDDPSARPVVDGHPLPVLTANQWAHLPSAWLQRRSQAA